MNNKTNIEIKEFVNCQINMMWLLEFMLKIIGQPGQ